MVLPGRRQFLGGAIAGLGELLRLQAAAAQPARAESCILIFLNGGMSHLDTLDPKPNQPAEIRGEFGTISTSAPGIRLTEHLPRLARQAHRLTIIRSVGFDGRLGNHSPACYHMMTGQEPVGDDAVLAPPKPTDQPTMGSAVARMRPTPRAVPAFVMVPDVLIENAHLTPGQFAGWLGRRYEAFRLQGDPSLPGFSVPALSRQEEVSDDRLNRRKQLLEDLATGRGREQQTASREIDVYYERAFDLLTSSKAQKAFDIAAEPPRIRDRYGRDKFGQSVLLARRAVEAGVRFVNVHWPNVGGGANWDTHRNGFNRLKDSLLPVADRAIASLIEDLDERGLLQQTLVLVLTEFGRAPQIGRTFQNSGGPGGRDHWSNCFSVLLAGGGLPGGRTYGSSDAKGAYPAERPMNPADLTATVYRLLGIDPLVTLHDAEGRTHRLCDGEPALELLP
jgi:hypothetical protein